VKRKDEKARPKDPVFAKQAAIMFCKKPKNSELQLRRAALTTERIIFLIFDNFIMVICFGDF